MIRNDSIRAILAGIALLAAADAGAAIRLNEVFVNSPGADDGNEFVEIRSTTGGSEALTGMSLLYLDGDAAAGTIINVVNLTAQSTGTNGILLLRDSATVLSPAPATGTNVFVQDFNPDLQNGTYTLLLVTNFTGAANDDLDPEKDGTLNTTPWSSVVDVVGFVENDTGTNLTYAVALGGTEFAAQAGFNADALVYDENSSAWFGADVLGTAPGPFAVDTTRVFPSTPTYQAYSLTPGARNFGPPASVSDWTSYE